MVVSKAVIAREPTHPSTVDWSLEDVDVHPPGDGEVLVEMRASGICHTDILLTSVPTGVFGLIYPKVPGHEGITFTLRTNSRLKFKSRIVLLTLDSFLFLLSEALSSTLRLLKVD